MPLPQLSPLPHLLRLPLIQKLRQASGNMTVVLITMTIVPSADLVAAVRTAIERAKLIAETMIETAEESDGIVEVAAENAADDRIESVQDLVIAREEAQEIEGLFLNFHLHISIYNC
jgi:hypothetical protein